MVFLFDHHEKIRKDIIKHLKIKNILMLIAVYDISISEKNIIKMVNLNKLI